MAKCDFCRKRIGKKRKRFCSNKCKDKWHNWDNPRGKFAHLADDLIHKDSDSMHDAVESDQHPFDPYSLGQE